MTSYTGTVIVGLKQAAKLGFPTLNIELTDTFLSGIFAGVVECGEKKYDAALYADQDRKTLEAHLLDFQGEIQNEEITITPLKKIREKELFDSTDLLKAAIENDLEKIRIFFEEK